MTDDAPGDEPQLKDCPYCAEPIRAAAQKCRWCGEWLIERSVTHSAEPEGGSYESIAADLIEPPLRLCVSAGLAPLADPGAGNAPLLDSLEAMRKQVSLEYGTVLPGVRVSAGQQLDDREFVLKLFGEPLVRGETTAGEPAEAIREISTLVRDAVVQHLGELMSREDVTELLNVARQSMPTVVAELVPNLLTVGQIRLVLKNLLADGVPIRDLSTILNALADHAYMTKDTAQLTEFVRSALARTISRQSQVRSGEVPAIMLDPEIERRLMARISLNETGQFLALEADGKDAFLDAVATSLKTTPEAVVLCQPKLRRFVQSLCEGRFPRLRVVSHSELIAGVVIEAVEFPLDPEALGPALPGHTELDEEELYESGGWLLQPSDHEP